MSQLLVSVQDVHGARVVTFETSQLIENTVHVIREQMATSFDGGHKWWVLDLRNVTFMASAGLGLMVQLAHRASAKGGKLVLAEATPQIVELLTGPTNLIQVIPLYRTQQEAIHALVPG